MRQLRHYFGSATAALLLLCLTAASVLAEERITSFHADLKIAKDGLVTVTERITVTVEGRAIRRGIFRDIPTTYKAADKSIYEVGLNVLSVTRNGATEPFVKSRKSNGVNIRIGNADVLLPHGPHTYEITYTAEGVIGFFEEFDELYWNVTGTDWAFDMDRATALVHPPPGGSFIGYEAYTGPPGAQGKAYTANQLGSELRFSTTGPVPSGEGLTVVASWPKGLVDEPTAAEKTQRFFRQNLPVFFAAAGFFSLLGYYFFIWVRVGRDPPEGTIFPRFSPPKGLGPAAVRFIRRMGYDRKALTAALINIAAKGHLKITDDGRTITLNRIDAAKEALTSAERQVMSALLPAGRESLELKQEHHRKFSSAINRLRNSLVTDHERGIFVRNQVHFWIGLAVTIAIVAVTSMVSVDPGLVLILSIATSVLTGVIGLLSIYVWTHAQTATSSFGGALLKLLSVVVGGLFLLIAIVVTLVVGALMAQEVSLWPPAFLGGAVVMNFVFFSLLKAPTLAGRGLMDEIEGFRMYLSIADAPRLEGLKPPEMTPELFEKNLGYAIALDVENEWSAQFESTLARVSEAPDKRASYQPSFYSGSRLSRFSAASFGGALGGAMSSAIASAATAPGSSSGSGGGGFSGGGGGGGGGGGW